MKYGSDTTRVERVYERNDAGANGIRSETTGIRSYLIFLRMGNKKEGIEYGHE